MDRLSIRQLLVFLIIFIIGISVCDAQALGTGPVGHTKKGLFGLSFGKKRDSKIKSPRTAGQVKKEQEKKKKKEQDDYVKSVKASQKKTIKIQSPEVKDRMKQDKKDIKAREKAKKAKVSTSTKKARGKYKK